MLVEDVPGEPKGVVMDDSACNPRLRAALSQISLRLQNPGRLHEVPLMEIAESTVTVDGDVSPCIGDDLSRNAFRLHQIVPVPAGLEGDANASEETFFVNGNARTDVSDDAICVFGRLHAPITARSRGPVIGSFGQAKCRICDSPSTA